MLRPPTDPMELGVSILAHPERWALHAYLIFFITPSLFQSSPTPKGGRYRRVGHHRGCGTHVSILAHPERWALPGQPMPLCLG